MKIEIMEMVEKSMAFLDGRNPLAMSDEEAIELINFVCDGMLPKERLALAAELAASIDRVEDPYTKLSSARLVHAICAEQCLAIDASLKMAREIAPEFFVKICDQQERS